MIQTRTSVNPLTYTVPYNVSDFDYMLISTILSLEMFPGLRWTKSEYCAIVRRILFRSISFSVFWKNLLKMNMKSYGSVQWQDLVVELFRK